MIRLQKLLLVRRLPGTTRRLWNSAGCRSSGYKHFSTFKTTTNQQRSLDSSVTQDYSTNPTSFTPESKDDATTTAPPQFTTLVNGPPIQFGIGKIANLTESSVIGSTGQTVALATMASSPVEDNNPNDSSVFGHLRRLCQESSSFLPLTVDYRQRHHAVGKIPTTANRADNRQPSDAETLASRAIDRALRPLLKPSSDAVHLTCSIQACPVNDEKGNGGYPVALALNSASVAMRARLKEPVACVYLCLTKNGTVLIDPAMPPEDAVGKLLLAGTKDKIVMMEFSGMLPESQLVDLIALAHGCIPPLLDTQEETVRIQQQTEEGGEDVDDDSLRAALGLPIITPASRIDDDTIENGENETKARQIFEQATEFCIDRLSETALRLFGVTTTDASSKIEASSTRPTIHSKTQQPLLSKSLRGRREHMFRQEIKRLLAEFEPAVGKEDFKAMVQDSPSVLGDLADPIHSKMLREAMKEASMRYQCRADGRGDSTNGCVSIRPLSMEVPALPDIVHGSSLFTRGETQVLCTATLGPPKDGIMLNDPYLPSKATPGEETDGKTFQDLPVGSLRYLKTQEYLQSDLNSRRVRADREQTGDSGILRERRRAFLQYDFPAYSKGDVQVGSLSGAKRREIGHGALAEKAILPILPSANDFPYTIRMTSEVTSSNGSSSMASVCGATLALLDAGVPITAPVAGVSVGLAKDRDDGDSYQTLLDITGTEDHYGAMDFKIAGTDAEVTAFQLDVDEPLPLNVISEALDLAKAARGVILQEMESQSKVSSVGAISELLPRSKLKASAPRVEVVRFDPMRKRDLLGPGGVVIRQLEDRFNVSVDLTQEGQCLLFGDDQEMVRKAKAAVMDLVADVEVGGVYEGTVIDVRDFGAIIELLRNKEGLCHVSELAERDEIKAHPKGTIGLINSILRVGQKIEVVCTAVDVVQGTIRLKPAAKKDL